MDQSIQDLLGQVTMKQEKEIAKMVFFFYPYQEDIEFPSGN